MHVPIEATRYNHPIPLFPSSRHDRSPFDAFAYDDSSMYLLTTSSRLTDGKLGATDRDYLKLTGTISPPLTPSHFNGIFPGTWHT